MKKILAIIALLSLLLSTLCACVPDIQPVKETANAIPSQSIRYVRFTLGNVIQDGNRAIFFEFLSDYSVTKMEISGKLLDKNGSVIYSFGREMEYTDPSRNPEFPITLGKNLIERVNSVRFTKITAYTNETVSPIVGEEKTRVLKYITTASEGAIRNFYGSGSEISINSDGEMTIRMTENSSSCGFQWYLSDIDLKPNTVYLVKFECMYVAAINNTSIRMKTRWHDSTYNGLTYYHVEDQRFDIISSGRVEECYYKILPVKKYDEYTMEFSFTHNVDEAEYKSFYFDFYGVRHQLMIAKISLYEVTYE